MARATERWAGLNALHPLPCVFEGRGGVQRGSGYHKRKAQKNDCCLEKAFPRLKWCSLVKPHDSISESVKGATSSQDVLRPLCKSIWGKCLTCKDIVLLLELSVVS